MTYSKAYRRRVKKGRPLLPAQEREANGRKSRRKSDQAKRRQENEAEIRSVALSARIRHDLARNGLSPSLADRVEAGSALGRAWLCSGDMLNYAHYLAGTRFGEDYRRYYALSGFAAPTVRALDLNRARGLAMDRPELAARARRHMLALAEAVRRVDQPGRPVASLLRQVCLLDDDSHLHLPHMVRLLARGLDALVAFYGISRLAEAVDET